MRDLFTNSKSVEICQNGSITFSDEKSKLTLRLNVKQEIRPLSQSLKGNFTITYNSLDIAGINDVKVSFDYTRISFQQCNINSAYYSVGYNNSFDITSAWIVTLVVCSFPDYEKEIVSLFDKSARFESTTNGKIFFD